MSLERIATVLFIPYMATTRFEAKQFLRDLLFLAAQRGGTEVVAIAGAPPAIKQQDQLTPLASHVLTSSQMQALTRALLQSRTGNEAQLRRGLFGTVKVAEKMWWRFRFQSHHSESTLRFSLLVAKEISLAKLGAPDKVLESASVSSGLLFVACRWPSWLHAVLSGLAIHRFYNGLGYTGTFEKATLRDHPAIIDALGEPVTACDDCSLTARLERFVAVADTQDVTALLLPPDPDPDVLQAAIEASRRLLCIVPVPAADQADGWANWLHERAVAMSDDVRERWLADIAATLVGAMRVRPVPRREVSGTTMAWSWLRRTDRLRIVIAAGKLSRLSALQCDPTQRLYGMLAFDDDLFDLHEAGNISYEDALRNADNSNAFRLAIKLKSRKRINTSCADEHLCILGSDPALKTLPPQAVQLRAFTAEAMAQGSSSVVDLWACLPSQARQVNEMAATTGQTMQAGLRVGLPLAQGAILGVTLQIDGLEVSESTQTLHWSGKPANIGFMVHAAQTARVGAHAARAVLSVEGASLGSLYFLVNVAPADRLRDLDPRHREVVGEHRHTQSAFASYATEDRPEMLARVQGMQVVAPDLDIFVDAISLRSGERWQQRIESELRERETLYLFWSAHAANSHWVRFEWQNMLALRGLQAIHPVPLADPREANPPAELASLHFGDAYLGWLLAEKARTLFTNESIECAIIRDATPPIA